MMLWARITARQASDHGDLQTLVGIAIGCSK